MRIYKRKSIMAYHHLSVLVHRQAEKYGNRAALKYKSYEKGQWISVSWAQFSEYVKFTANALVESGIKEQENIGVFSQNKPECLYVDFAAFSIRAVTIPLYATSSPDQVRYMVNDAGIRYLFVGEQFQYDAAFGVLGVCNSLQQLIIFDRSVRLDPRDRTSIYFDEFLKTGWQAFKAHDIRLTSMTDKDISMNFLPLAHIFERAWTYFCLHKGALVCINLRPTDIQTSIKEIRPTLMCSVPRFWEKVYSAVQEKISQATGIKKKIMLDALRVGKMHNIDCISKGETPSIGLHLKYKFYEKTVYSLLKKTIGIENGNFFPTAGAAVPDKVCEFVHSVGINMIVGYGLTESTATVSCTLPDRYTIGSVGFILPGLEVKIDENHEILLRGKTITKGYYKKIEATTAAIDKDGWFHTGDAGYMKNGELFLTERIKDLFKTSNGKYIAPQAIESRLVIDRYIDQIAIIADQCKFVSALIVPEYELVEEYAKQKGINYQRREDLLQNPKIIALFKARIDTLQQSLAHYEQIKRFTLLPHPFSMEKGELTNTLKIKRDMLYKNFAREIEDMYKE